MKSRQIVDGFRKFKPLVTRVVCTAWKDAIACHANTGRIRPGELGSLLHVTMRTGFRVAADELDPYIVLVEEPDGRGLDYLKVDIGAKTPLAVRFSKQNKNRDRISRNQTCRTADILDQGMLFDDDDEELPVVTIVVRVSDHYYESGKLCAFLSRIVLVHEYDGGFDFLDRIARFSKSDPNARAEDVGVPRIGIKDERREIQEEITALRKKLA